MFRLVQNSIIVRKFFEHLETEIEVFENSKSENQAKFPSIVYIYWFDRFNIIKKLLNSYVAVFKLSRENLRTKIKFQRKLNVRLRAPF